MTTIHFRKADGKPNYVEGGTAFSWIDEESAVNELGVAPLEARKGLSGTYSTEAEWQIISYDGKYSILYLGDRVSK